MAFSTSASGCFRDVGRDVGERIEARIVVRGGGCAADSGQPGEGVPHGFPVNRLPPLRFFQKRICGLIRRTQAQCRAGRRRFSRGTWDTACLVPSRLPPDIRPSRNAGRNTRQRCLRCVA